MDSKDIEADLQLRYAESRQWVASDPGPLQLKFRNRDWLLQPIAFLDEPNRAERFGVAFYFEPTDSSKIWKTQLNLRIQPKFNPEFELHKFPYAVTYVVDQLANAEVEISHTDIVVPEHYSRLIGLPLEEWYLYWMNRVLAGKHTGKIFESRMQVSE